MPSRKRAAYSGSFTSETYKVRCVVGWCLNMMTHHLEWHVKWTNNECTWEPNANSRGYATAILDFLLTTPKTSPEQFYV
eukprot:647863-Rhodomonas_salina.2